MRGEIRYGTVDVTDEEIEELAEAFDQLTWSERTVDEEPAPAALREVPVLPEEDDLLWLCDVMRVS